jgi:hypothetical protein
VQFLIPEWGGAIKPRRKALPGFSCVCSFPSRTLRHVAYREAGAYRFFLWLNSRDEIVYAAVISDNDFTVLDSSTYAQYAIYSYMVEGDEGPLREVIRESAKEPFVSPGILLDYLNFVEGKNSVTVHNRELYDYLKALLALNQIASSP